MNYYEISVLITDSLRSLTERMIEKASEGQIVECMWNGIYT